MKKRCTVVFDFDTDEIPSDELRMFIEDELFVMPWSYQEDGDFNPYFFPELISYRIEGEYPI